MRKKEEIANSVFVLFYLLACCIICIMLGVLLAHEDIKSTGNRFCKSYGLEYDGIDWDVKDMYNKGFGFFCKEKAEGINGIMKISSIGKRK